MLVSQTAQLLDDLVGIGQALSSKVKEDCSKGLHRSSEIWSRRLKHLRNLIERFAAGKALSELGE